MDVTATGDFRVAGISDDISMAFDYQVVEKIAKEVFEGTSKKLIETLCFSIGDRLFKKFTGISTLEVAVRKMHPPLLTKSEFAEVRMTWQR